MLDAVFNQRLQQHARHHGFERCRIEILDNLELVPSKTHDFNIQIIIDELHFLAQRNKRIRTVQQAAKNGSEFQVRIISRAVSGSKRTSDEMEFRVLNRKCGLI